MDMLSKIQIILFRTEKKKQFYRQYVYVFELFFKARDGAPKESL